MSGICGIINFDGAPVDPALLEKMAQAAAYRGPDGIHYWIDGNVGLAHLALHITPESLRERQPLHNARGNLTLVADVRIDNRDELIPFLASKGLVHERDAQGNTPTDADLILAAYECWGEDCPQHLLGDFVFVVWDAGQKRAFAAVDHQGMKILHYRHEGPIFQFASDACQLLHDPRFPVRLDEVTIARDLTLPNVGGQHESYYQGIHKLAAAERLCVAGPSLKTERYWNHDPEKQIRYKTDEEYTEHFLSLFRSAVTARLRSVRPIYLFASGGHDSLSIAALAASEIAAWPSGPAPDFQAITFVSQENPLEEELKCCRLVTDRWNIPRHEINIDPFPLLSDQPPFAPHQDEPGNVAFRPFMVGALSTFQPDSALYMTGGSGDGIVGVGNPFYYLDMISKLHFRALHETLRAHSQMLGTSYRWLAREMLWGPLVHDPVRRLLSLARAHLLPETSKMVPLWINRSWARRIGLLEWVREQPSLHFLVARKQFGRDQAVDWRYRLLNDPRNSRIRRFLSLMFASWRGEYWSPWDDIHLEEFALAVPQEQLTSGVNRKLILRRAMKPYFPEEVNERIRLKTGPEKWVQQAFAKPGLTMQLNDMLANTCLLQMGFLEPEPFKAELERVQQGVRLISFRVWLGLILEIWLRLYHQP